MWRKKKKIDKTPSRPDFSWTYESHKIVKQTEEDKIMQDHKGLQELHNQLKDFYELDDFLELAERVGMTEEPPGQLKLCSVCDEERYHQDDDYMCIDCRKTVS